MHSHGVGVGLVILASWRCRAHGNEGTPAGPFRWPARPLSQEGQNRQRKILKENASHAAETTADQGRQETHHEGERRTPLEENPQPRPAAALRPARPYFTLPA